MFTKIRTALGSVCVALLLSGCPELLIGINVSGNYTGTWRTDTGADDETEACPISLELLHFPNASNLADATEVTGYVNLDFTCFPVLSDLLLFQEIAVGEVEVVGYALAGGTFLLRSVDILGGCNGDLCINLVMTGQALDEDGDGMVDALSGEWTALFPLPERGQFAATVVLETVK